MFKTLQTIFLGRIGRAEQALETENAAIIIEQKIRDADAAHMSAKRGLATLITRTKSERKALARIDQRLADLNPRIEAALTAKKQDLALDAAKLCAELENEKATRLRTLESSQEKADRIRLHIEKTQRRLVDLRQGLHTAQSIETERRAMSQMRGTLSANSAIQEGEAVLGRLLASDDPTQIMESYEQINAELSGDTVIDRLTEAGFGPSNKVRPQDVLARFQTPPVKKTA